MAGLITITQNTFYVFIGIFVAMGVFMLMTILLVMFTPAMTFLKAKMRRKSVIYAVNRSQLGQFYLANDKFPGIAETKKAGPFIISENSHTIERKSSIPLFFGFVEFAGTIPLKWAGAFQKVRLEFEKSGKDMKDIDDYGKLIGLKYNEEKKIWEHMPDSEKTKLSEEEQKNLTDIQIKPFQTINIHNLVNMFPFDINPSLVQSKIEHAIAAKQRLSNIVNFQFIMLFVMILIGAAVAGGIIYKLTTGGTSTCHVVLDQAAGIIRSNYTG